MITDRYKMPVFQVSKNGLIAVYSCYVSFLLMEKKLDAMAPCSIVRLSFATGRKLE